jgi:hypothetical protein
LVVVRIVVSVSSLFRRGVSPLGVAPTNSRPRSGASVA